MTGKENRLNFRMTDETAAKIERWYKQDNCRSKNEFIEKAVNFYTDMLSAGDNSMLPMAIQSAIDGRLKLFEDCMASLLFKQTVETDMGLSILLQSVNVDEEVLRHERQRVLRQSNAPMVACGWSRSSASWRMTNGKTDRQEPVYQVRQQC